MILSKEEKARRQKIYDNPKLWPKCQVCGKPITWVHTVNGNGTVRHGYWLKRKTCDKGCKYKLQSQRQLTGKCAQRRKAYSKQTNYVDSDRVIAVATAIGEPIKQGFYVFDMPRPHYSPADERAPRRL